MVSRHGFNYSLTLNEEKGLIHCLKASAFIEAADPCWCFCVDLKLWEEKSRHQAGCGMTFSNKTPLAPETLSLDIIVTVLSSISVFT